MSVTGWKNSIKEVQLYHPSFLMKFFQWYFLEWFLLTGVFHGTRWGVIVFHGSCNTILIWINFIWKQGARRFVINLHNKGEAFCMISKLPVRRDMVAWKQFTKETNTFIWLKNFITFLFIEWYTIQCELQLLLT